MSSRAMLKGQTPGDWLLDPAAESRSTSVGPVSPQLRFGMTIGIYCFIFTLLIICLGSYPPVFERLVGGSDEMAGYHRALLLEFTGFIMSHWWIPLLVSLAMGAASVLYSYRIFSSIRHFEEALQLKRRDPYCQVNLSLRKRDYFHQFSNLLEEVLNAPVPPGPPGPPVEEDKPHLELARQG